MGMIGRYGYPTAQSVVVCGDIHGQFEGLVYEVCVLHEMRDTLVIVAGDCGFGFEAGDRHYYHLYNNKLRKRLEGSNCWLDFVRGNHDDYEYFRGTFGAERFRAVPDYSVITACGHQILCVGGATSVDRTRRTLGVDLFQNEEPRYSKYDLDEIRKSYRIDTVVTHCAPSFCHPFGISESVRGFALEDHALLKDINKDRDIMDSILRHLRCDGHPLRYWLYGHYHNSWHENIDGVDYTMLGIMELKEIKPTNQE